MKREEYPINAMRFNAPVEIEQATEESPAKVKMLARSAQPIDHWFWGTIVHDNSGAKFKDSIPLDYCHDDKEIIGFAASEDIKLDEEKNLTIDGQIVTFGESDRASEVLAKSKAGVPYEASINFAGDGIKLERVKEGDSVEVNGYEFNGPGVVVREWPLRGVAVCPYGADGNTKSEFSSSDVIAVTVLEEESIVSDEQQTSEAVENEVENTAPVEQVAELSVDPRAELKRFAEAFGNEKAGEYYAADLSFEDAMVKFCGELKEENNRLKAEVQHLSNSSSDPVPASVEEEKPAPTNRFRFVAADQN